MSVNPERYFHAQLANKNGSSDIDIPLRDMRRKDSKKYDLDCSSIPHDLVTRIITWGHSAGEKPSNRWVLPAHELFLVRGNEPFVIYHANLTTLQLISDYEPKTSNTTTTTTLQSSELSQPVRITNRSSSDTPTTTTTQSSSPTTDESEQKKTSSSSSSDESSPLKTQYPELWRLFEDMIVKESQKTALLGRNSAITTWGNSYQSQNLTLDGDDFSCLEQILAYSTQHNISSEEMERVERAVREERTNLLNKIDL